MSFFPGLVFYRNLNKEIGHKEEKFYYDKVIRKFHSQFEIFMNLKPVVINGTKHLVDISSKEKVLESLMLENIEKYDYTNL